MLFNFNQDIHQHNNYLRGEVEHVDEDQTEGDEEDDPGRDDVGGDEEGDPAHHHEHPRGQVNGEDERTQGTCQNYLHPINTVISWNKRKY